MNLFLIFQYGLIGAFVALLATFLLVMVSDSVEGHVSHLLGLYTKNPILKFLGIGMGGVLLALQALMSYKRAKALEDTANAQAEAAKAQAKATEEQAKANENTEQGQRQERLKNAIEHLGHASDSVRLGGAYELFHLAQDTKDLRQTVLDILCAHIRRTTGEAAYREKYKFEPSEEVQSLLTLLFVQEREIFKGLRINLKGSWLNGADLREARLARAILTNAYLQRALLQGAHLQRTGLAVAHLEEAVLTKAWLHGADLLETYMQGAALQSVRLYGADLRGVKMQGAYLPDAHLQGAFLQSVSLEGATLSRARLQGTGISFIYLQGASLNEAKLHGAGTDNWSSSMPFAERIKRSIGKESNLSSVFFGGIGRGGVDLLVEGLSDKKARILREILRPHIDQPVSHELPENSGAITGAYTAKEAEQWIAEYNEAMSEVPEGDS